MPKLKEQTRKNKAAYDVKYARENVTRKFIPFNRQNPQDQAMLDWLDEKENVTAYIKSLILGDMPEAGK